MFQLPVTSTGAALSSFALILLSLNVSRLRMRHRISVGTLATSLCRLRYAPTAMP
ncbi:hypothetical protein [Pseudomonas aeruginosa]|uniref:hypothetical protein n=1 Tax=Pseudomonas aeruginosa TaxID=287 RepID=UPI000ACD8535|nr:hypothetical protein [Pseudomonas aeruginosa]